MSQLFLIILSLIFAPTVISHADVTKTYRISIPVNADTVFCVQSGTLLNWPGLSKITRAHHEGLLGAINGNGDCYARNWINLALKNQGFLTADIAVTWSTSCTKPWDCEDPLNGSTCVDPGYFEFDQIENVVLRFVGEPPYFDFVNNDNGIVSSTRVNSCPVTSR